MNISLQLDLCREMQKLAAAFHKRAVTQLVMAAQYQDENHLGVAIYDQRMAAVYSADAMRLLQEVLQNWKGTKS